MAKSVPAQAEQTATPFVFEAPDNLKHLVQNYKKYKLQYIWALLRWIRFGPNEEQDRAKFEAQWKKGEKDGDTSAIAEHYKDQRTARLTALGHLKSDVNTLFTLIGLVLVGISTVAPDRVQSFLHSPVRHAGWLLPFSWLIASSSHAHRFLYTFYTNFIGAAHWGKDVVDQKTYVDKIRREVNSLSRTLQRGRRRYNLALIALIALAYYIAKFLFEF